MKSLSQCNKDMHVRRPQWREGLWLVNVDGRWVYNEGGKPSQETQLAVDFYELHPNREAIAAWLNNQAVRFFREDGCEVGVRYVIASPLVPVQARYSEPTYTITILLGKKWNEIKEPYTNAEIKELEDRGYKVQKVRQCS